MRWLFLMCGVIATAAMIAISMRLNFLFGYGLGQTPEKALVFGGVSVIADAWKGLAPVFILGLTRARRWTSALAASIVWGACFLYSISSAIGIGIHDRVALTGGQETLKATYEDLRSELAEQDRRRKLLSGVRSAKEIEATITAVLARPIVGGNRVRGTVATISNSCMKTDGRTADPCAEVAILRRELATAVEAARLDELISELRRRGAQLRERGAMRAPDPQSEFFSQITQGRVSVQAVGPSLVVLLATVVELISAFGLTVIVAYADATRERPQNEPSELAGFAIDYMAERIEPADTGAALSSEELCADYAAWCRRKFRRALIATEFIEAFNRSLIEHGLDEIQKLGDRYYGVRLTDEGS